MVKVSDSQYDGGDVGDSNLTQSRVFADDSTHYDTVYQQDWRDRQTDARGPDKVATKTTYDNLGEVTEQDTYADADTDFVIDGTELRGRGQNFYDKRGQLYRTIVSNVDPTTGTEGDTLTSNMWYDPRGMQVESDNANGLFAKTAYDGLGQVIGSYTSFDDSETDYADALTIDGDTVIEQQKNWYDVQRGDIRDLPAVGRRHDHDGFTRSGRAITAPSP